jgi:hypothetical protein
MMDDGTYLYCMFIPVSVSTNAVNKIDVPIQLHVQVCIQYTVQYSDLFLMHVFGCKSQLATGICIDSSRALVM